MAYNQKKSIIQGTSSHASALKQNATWLEAHGDEKRRWETEGRPSKEKFSTFPPNYKPKNKPSKKKKAGWGEGWLGLPDIGVTEFLDKHMKPKKRK